MKSLWHLMRGVMTRKLLVQVVKSTWFLWKAFGLNLVYAISVLTQFSYYFNNIFDHDAWYYNPRCVRIIMKQWIWLIGCALAW